MIVLHLWHLILFYNGLQQRSRSLCVVWVLVFSWHVPGSLGPLKWQKQVCGRVGGYSTGHNSSLFVELWCTEGLSSRMTVACQLKMPQKALFWQRLMPDWLGDCFWLSGWVTDSSSSQGSCANGRLCNRALWILTELRCLTFISWIPGPNPVSVLNFGPAFLCM